MSRSLDTTQRKMYIRTSGGKAVGAQTEHQEVTFSHYEGLSTVQRASEKEMIYVYGTELSIFDICNNYFKVFFKFSSGNKSV